MTNHFNLHLFQCTIHSQRAHCYELIIYTLLTLAIWSNFPKSSFSMITSSLGEQSLAKRVKPTMSAYRILKEWQRKSQKDKEDSYLLFCLTFDLKLKRKNVFESDHIRRDLRFDMTFPEDKKTLCWTAAAQCNSCLNTHDEQKLHKEGSWKWAFMTWAVLSAQ